MSLRKRRQKPAVRRHGNLFAAVALMGAVVGAGVAGYQAIEGWDAFDSLYMTVITIASVGYGETHPLSHAGRVFTIALILSGTGVLVYGISAVTAFIVEGGLSDTLRRRKMRKTIDALEGHIVLCGDSSTGRYVIEELDRTGEEFVVVENDRAKLEELSRAGILCVEGDAASDVVLREAGVARARGLIATLHSDADNLFVVLTAKGINPGLRVISKAVAEESEEKLKKVGADGVVLPNHIGGLRMVSAMIRPRVVSFLDVMLRETDRAVRVEEVNIGSGSRVVGKQLGDTEAMRTEGASLVALQRTSASQYQFNPPATTTIEAGDSLIYLGLSTTIRALGERLNAGR